MDRKEYMGQIINLDVSGAPLKVECQQHDIGCIKRFVTETDLTGKVVKYVADLKEDGHTVTSWCQVLDAHTFEMVIPPQITAEPGTYSAQIIVISAQDEANDFQAWKALVLAGSTPVLIEGKGSAPSSSSQSADGANLSFVFSILVYPSVYANGSYFEGDLNGLIKKIEQDNARITKENDALKKKVADLEEGASNLSRSLTALGQTVNGNTTEIKNLGSTVGSQGETLSSLSGSVSSLNETVGGHGTSIGSINNSLTTLGGKVTTLESEKDTMSSDLTTLTETVTTNRQHCDSEVDRLEGLIQQSGEAGDLALWKEQVLAGATPVLIQQDETPVANAPAADQAVQEGEESNA